MDIGEAIDWKLAPLEILRTEDALPGLWDGIFLELWQRRLIKETMGEDS